MKYYSTKTYGHDVGLSACFRQWRAKSHCSKFHGYSLSFSYKFACTRLDENGWVLDFGALKPIKQWLVDNFDHKLLISEDDPYLDKIYELPAVMVDINMVKATGCEAFAKMAFDHVGEWLKEKNHWPRVGIESVEVREHGANSAIYEQGYQYEEDTI